MADEAQSRIGEIPSHEATVIGCTVQGGWYWVSRSAANGRRIAMPS
jgi:hypothetical protein